MNNTHEGAKMQVTENIITKGVIEKRKRDGKSLHNLVLRTDPDTFEEVRQYALENNCAASQAVRELIEIGLETVYADNGDAVKKTPSSKFFRSSDCVVNAFGEAYAAVVFGNYVLKQSKWSKNTFELLRYKLAADGIRALLYSEAEKEISTKSLDHIKTAISIVAEEIMNSALHKVADNLNACRRMALKQ
jgi:hypothetical protein